MYTLGGTDPVLVYRSMVACFALFRIPIFHQLEMHGTGTSMCTARCTSDVGAISVKYKLRKYLCNMSAGWTKRWEPVHGGRTGLSDWSDPVRVWCTPHTSVA